MTRVKFYFHPRSATYKLSCTPVRTPLREDDCSAGPVGYETFVLQKCGDMPEHEDFRNLEEGRRFRTRPCRAREPTVDQKECFWEMSFFPSMFNLRFRLLSTNKSTHIHWQTRVAHLKTACYDILVLKYYAVIPVLQQLQVFNPKG